MPPAATARDNTSFTAAHNFSASSRVTRFAGRNGEQAVVMMSLEDFKALEETSYLLRSPKNAKRLLESIADLVHEKRIDGIADLNDESNREGMRIVIELKRGTQPRKAA